MENNAPSLKWNGNTHFISICQHAFLPFSPTLTFILSVNTQCFHHFQLGSSAHIKIKQMKSVLLCDNFSPWSYAVTVSLREDNSLSGCDQSFQSLHGASLWKNTPYFWSKLRNCKHRRLSCSCTHRKHLTRAWHLCVCWLVQLVWYQIFGFETFSKNIYPLWKHTQAHTYADVVRVSCLTCKLRGQMNIFVSLVREALGLQNAEVVILTKDTMMLIHTVQCNGSLSSCYYCHWTHLQPPVGLI